MTITIKSQAELAKMRSAGRIVAEVLALVEEALVPGVSTAELDRLAEAHIRASGGTPSFLGYLGGRRYNLRDPRAYRNATCISIDHEIVHGIPGDRELKAGQIVSVDVGVIYQEWNGDGARSFICGGPQAGTPAAVALVEATRLSMMAGIAAARPGNHVEDIGIAVEAIAKDRGYGVVRGYTGHGIGRDMHEDPSVPNFRSGWKGIKLKPGICLAIEPMFTVGHEETALQPDGWTVVTVDRSLAAHFEHTVAVTSDGPEILTKV
ncbi:MAG: type I methionyl aminopeptidase [Candidatus Limnocylindrales bacterium]